MRGALGAKKGYLCPNKDSFNKWKIGIGEETKIKVNLECQTEKFRTLKGFRTRELS